MTRSRLLCLVLLSVALAPSPAFACPVCFGGSDSPLLDSARWGVVAMVAVTVCVLAVFAAWFLRLRRLSRGAEAQS
jgi:hypothetical protein